MAAETNSKAHICCSCKIWLHFPTDKMVYIHLYFIKYIILHSIAVMQPANFVNTHIPSFICPTYFEPSPRGNVYSPSPSILDKYV